MLTIAPKHRRPTKPTPARLRDSRGKRRDRSRTSLGVHRCRDRRFSRQSAVGTDCLAARERWAHIENDEAFEVLKSLHDPHDGRTELRIKNLVGVLEEVRPTCFGRCSSILGRTAPRLGRSKKIAADASTSCGPRASHQLYAPRRQRVL